MAKIPPEYPKKQKCLGCAVRRYSLEDTWATSTDHLT